MYFSSVNCKILISKRLEGGTLIKKVVKEAYALEVNRNDQIMPYYNWLNKIPKDLLTGQSIVQGNLILNIFSTNYLVGLLTGRNVVDGSEKTLSQREDALSAAQDIFSRRITTDNEIDLKLDFNQMRLLARQQLQNLEERTDSNSNTLEYKDVVFSNSYKEQIFSEPFDFIIDTPEQQEKVEGVRLAGKSFQINGGSSMNIKYAFPFVAKTCSI
jgi:hypothetical protein